MRVLILMAYYQRPILVQNALTSILKANEFHEDWELGFWDDGSKISGRPIVEDILKYHLHKVRFDKNKMTIDNKIEAGLILGRMANVAIRDSNADIGIILCDDDELVPTYLKNLSNHYSTHDHLYCYSKIHLYNPLVQKSEDVDNVIGKYNQWNEPINPAGRVDASQVSWRLSCCKEHGAWFADTTNGVGGKPWAKDIDHSFFENLYNKCGLCYPTGFFGQYKGIHNHQLLWSKSQNAEGLKELDKKYNEHGGTEF